MQDSVEVKFVEDNKIVAYLSGRIDVILADNIETQLIEVINSKNIKFVILDFQSVEYISSSGFRVAVYLFKTLKDKGGELKLCSMKPEIKRMFDLIELTSLFDIYPTKEDAINSF